MITGLGTLRARHVREAYPHERGEPLLSTAQIAALTGLSTRTVLRRLQALKVDPARRGGHGRLWWRRADAERLLD